MRCYYCGTIYPLGQKIQRDAGWHYFPDAERSLWEHWRTEEHKSVTNEYGKSMYAALQILPEVLSKAKEYQKLRENPEFKNLTTLFR